MVNAFFLTALPFLISAVPTPSALEAVKWFEEGAWTTSHNKEPISIPYRVHIPQGLKGNPLPLLIWFHGHGESGTDNVSQLRYMDTVFETSRGAPGAVILAVQEPVQGALIAGTEGNEFDYIEVVHEIAEKIAVSYPIDRDRVYVSGISSGGTNCWMYGMRYWNEIAALAPMATGSVEIERTENLSKIPVWAFHSANDVHVDSSGAKRMIEAINQNGGAAFLTLTPPNEEYTHDCWTAAFAEYGLLDWLCAQTRSKYPPYLHPETSLQIKQNSILWGAWFSLISVIALLVVSEVRRRSGRPPTGNGPDCLTEI